MNTLLSKLDTGNRRLIRMAVVAALLIGLALPVAAAPSSEDPSQHEVWIIDQSDTTADGGGTLYIYQGEELSGQDAATAVPEVIDLGGVARTLCLNQTGTAPRRPHMLFFNAAQTHAIISFVATGHVLFMDAATRTPTACVDVGAQAHAAVPSPDQTYVIVANQNGKKLHRILTDYATNSFTLDTGATLDLATCTTPNSFACQDATLRPDTAPIFAVIDPTSHFAFVTLRGGGLFVVDNTVSPMGIVAEYDRATIHPNGLGVTQSDGKVYINSGGGSASNPLESDLYVLPLSGYSATPNPTNTPAPTVIFSHDNQGDSHGSVLTKQDRFLWVADRAGNRIVVVDTANDQVVNEIALAAKVSADPAPDLMDIAPSGNRVYISLRGPKPLTGNVAGVDNAVGSTPGVGVVRVERDGEQGVLQAIAPITHVVSGVERGDPHAIRVRRSK